MRVAALYDIHGNLPALEAVLDDVRQYDVDMIVVGGDVVPGPMPRESLDRLLTLDRPTKFLMGNGDREVLAQLRGESTPWFEQASEERRAPVRWSANQLASDHAQAIERWPAFCVIEVTHLGMVRFCHATPRNDTDIFTRDTPAAHVVLTLVGISESMVVCGHTHMQFDRQVGHCRVINAGSVGMPFGQPGAYWLLLDDTIKLQRTDYDLDAAAQWVGNTKYPEASDFAERHVLRPPLEQEMLEAFEKMAVGVSNADADERG